MRPLTAFKAEGTASRRTKQPLVVGVSPSPTAEVETNGAYMRHVSDTLAVSDVGKVMFGVPQPVWRKVMPRTLFGRMFVPEQSQISPGTRRVKGRVPGFLGFRPNCGRGLATPLNLEAHWSHVRVPDQAPACSR